MLNVTITNPDGLIAKEETNCVVAKTFNGEVSIYPGHLPYLSTITNGYVKINDKQYDIKSGNILVDENNNVTILSN